MVRIRPAKRTGISRNVKWIEVVRDPLGPLERLDPLDARLSAWRHSQTAMLTLRVDSLQTLHSSPQFPPVGTHLRKREGKATRTASLRIHRTASLASLTGMAASAAHRSQLLHSAGLLCGTHLTPFAPRRTVRSGLHASKARCFCTPRYAGAMPCSSSHCLGTRVLGHRPRALVPYAACARSAGSDVSCVARSARRGSSSRPSSPKPTAASASRRAPEPARATPGRSASDLRAAGGQQPVEGRQHRLRGAPRRPHPACPSEGFQSRGGPMSSHIAALT